MGQTFFLQGGTMDGEGYPLTHTTRAAPATVSCSFFLFCCEKKRNIQRNTKNNLGCIHWLLCCRQKYNSAVKRCTILWWIAYHQIQVLSAAIISITWRQRSHWLSAVKTVAAFFSLKLHAWVWNSYSSFQVKWLLENFEPCDGVSLPRSVLYNFYIHHCQTENVEPSNPASFGKLVRMIFRDLKTRRLGQRYVLVFRIFAHIRFKSLGCERSINVDCEYHDHPFWLEDMDMACSLYMYLIFESFVQVYYMFIIVYSSYKVLIS